MTPVKNKPSFLDSPADSQEQLLLEYQALFDNASVGILYSADSRIQRHNSKFAEMFGFTGNEAIGMPGRCIYPSDEAYHELGRLAGPLLSQGKPIKQELYMRREDGSDFWVNLIGYVADPGDPTQGTWWILEDRSDFKRAEESLQKSYVELKETHRRLEDAQTQLLQSEKLASIGQLAAGVAHEINNPIGFVTSNLGSLGRYIEDLLRIADAATDSPAAQAVAKETDLPFLREDLVNLLAESRDGLERVSRIVANLKDFSHIDEAEWQHTDLVAGLESTISVLWHELKDKTEIVRELQPLPPVRCMPAQINQVFMNLLLNAAQAIPDRGTITVGSGKENGQVWIEVADTGCGMNEDVKRRIFEPFFTTKPVGKGTGLGLSLSYDIVDKHGGTFEVDSKPGVGSRIRLWLPVAGPTEL